MLREVTGYLVQCNTCKEYLAEEGDIVFYEHEDLVECFNSSKWTESEDYKTHLCPKCQSKQKG